MPVFSTTTNFPSAEHSETWIGPLALRWKVVFADISPFNRGGGTLAGSGFGFAGSVGSTLSLVAGWELSGVFAPFGLASLGCSDGELFDGLLSAWDLSVFWPGLFFGEPWSGFAELGVSWLGLSVLGVSWPDLSVLGESLPDLSDLGDSWPGFSDFGESLPDLSVLGVSSPVFEGLTDCWSGLALSGEPCPAEFGRLLSDGEDLLPGRDLSAPWLSGLLPLLGVGWFDSVDCLVGVMAASPVPLPSSLGDLPDLRAAESWIPQEQWEIERKRRNANC